MTSRIMTNNFVDPDVISLATASSEQSAFPAENVYNMQRRSKVWRSEGYWEITSSNKSIVFRETNAVDLTANVQETTYSGDTDFFAAIKLALEVTGDSTYTVSRDSTHRVVITSDGAGGGGIFEIDWTTSTAMAALLGYDDSAEDTGALTYTADQIVLHQEEWLTWDMGISTNPDCFIMIGKRNSPIKLTPSATFKLQGNETNVWTGPSYETTLTYDERVMSVFRASTDEGLHTEGLRYWRLQLVDPQNALGYLELGAVFLGDFFQPTRGAIQFPFQGQYIDRSPTIFSEGGQTFSDEQEKSEVFSVEWFGLTISEKEELDEHFDNVGTVSPFFLQFDPNAAISSSSRYYIRYCKFVTSPQYDLVSPGNYRMRMTLREEL